MPAEQTAQLDSRLRRLPNRSERGIYLSVAEMDDVSPPLACAHTVRRLFRDLDLAGVLYVGRMPRAVFKRVGTSLPHDEVREWHRTLWNHAVTPLLVLFSDTKVWVYSGQALPARESDDLDKNGRLVRDLDAVADVLEFDNLITSIESGEVFRDNRLSFNRENAVDRYLLRNIADAADLLCKCPGRQRPLTLEEARQLLLRLLFACYLIDRDMIMGQHFPEKHPLHGLQREGGLRAVLEGQGPEKRVEVLCQLFGRIGELFNGSAFSAEDLANEKQLLTAEHLDVLTKFLRGDDLGAGQLALGFWAYDFKNIPIETVSAIYESFLESEQGETREQTGAYYTPPHLAELVVDILIEDLPKRLLDCTALDPACGSGIFLVALFNRMAEEWRREHPHCRNLTRARALQQILKEQLFGIDDNPTACQIACFSLYLAYLDQLTPPDVEELREEGVRLPKLLLAKGETQPAGERRTVIRRNFFGDDRQLPTEKFDLIAGNPPWVSRGGVKDAAFVTWCDNTKRPVPQNQMACGFMWEALPLLAETGRACFLLPSAILLGRTDKFQGRWFHDAKVTKIVDFSDLRFLLFAGAIHPAIAMRFESWAEPVDMQIEYLAPKTAIVSQLGGPVLIHDEDSSLVSLAEVLHEAKEKNAALVWKTRLWGTPRDRRFLQRLADMPALNRLAGKPREKKRWVKGVGFQPYLENDEKKKGKKWFPWWTEDHLFLDASNPHIHYLVVQEDCSEVRKAFDVLRRPPDKRLYEGPKLLVSKGSKNIKVAFCEFPVLFRDALQSIAGAKQDADLLRFLTAVIHSQLSQYFLFHTSASVGTERDQTFSFELLRLPFPLPEECEQPDRAREIVMEVSRQVQDLSHRIRSRQLDIGRKEAAQELERSLDPLIEEYYGIDGNEAMLIKDTLDVFKASATPGSPTTPVPALRRPQPPERIAYVDTLREALRVQTVPGFKEYIVGSVVADSIAGIAVITLSRSSRAKETVETEAAAPLSKTLWKLAEALPLERRSLTYVRNLKIIENGCIHIVKPLAWRFWTRTAALNDADEILGAMLMRGRAR